MESHISIDEFINTNKGKLERKGLFNRCYYTPTGSRMRSYKRYVRESGAVVVRESINTGQFSGWLSMNTETSTNAMVHVLISDDRKAALIQLVEYEAYCPVPATTPLLIENDQVGFVQRFLKLK